LWKLAFDCSHVSHEAIIGVTVVKGDSGHISFTIPIQKNLMENISVNILKGKWPQLFSIIDFGV
jgi:hypothetical protein